MNPALLLFILAAFQANAQDSTVRLTFKEIGWTIDLPKDFKIFDSSTIERMNRDGAKLAAAKWNRCGGSCAINRT